MRIARLNRSSHRCGTVLPMLAVALTSLFGFVALAVDLGMLAVSRTECQNAADAAALIGCRMLNNNSSDVNSNLAAAVSAATTVGTSNTDMGANYTFPTQITEIDAGQYLYNSTTQTFAVYNGNGSTSGYLGWTNVTSSQSATPTSGSWTAMQVTVTYTQPMYFLTVLGVSSMPTGAVAASVYRPRDTAFILDMTGSMAYASQFNYNNGSNNPDTLVPMFGHYSSTYPNLIQNTNQTLSTGEAVSQSNYCIYTPDGLPIIRDFVYDPTNISNPSTSAYPITSNTSSLQNAFHRWGGSLTASMSGNYPPESGADTLSYLGPTYNFTGYNAFDTTNTYGPTPAPDNFMYQLDSGSITYVGDRYPRLDGKVWTTPSSTSSTTSGFPYPLYTPTPSWTDATSGAATNDLTYLGISISSMPNPPSGTKNSSGGSLSSYNNSWTGTNSSTTSYNFRDPAWETYGYDLIMGPVGTTGTYRYVRNKVDTTNGQSSPVGTPVNPSNVTSSMNYATLSGSTWSGTNANRFKGYSMGPGYWGKTFFIWPPDPRFNSSANLTSPNTTYPAFDTSGNAMCDWRRHFFLNSSGNAFNPQTTNINTSLFSTGSGQTLNNSGFTINYPAVLAWIKSGPQVLPPNLRAGRIVYYSSIPNDVNTATASGQAQLDKVFWQNYINYVLAYSSYTSAGYLYGQADNWSSDGVTINSSSPSAIQYSWESSSLAPYMNYSDSPLRPRLHFWFGPLSMVDFISGIAKGANWNPGTCHEAQCWQLKVAMNSVISDVQNNHPNDTLGMVMFSANAYNGPRVGQGQNYTALQNALFYPFSLLTSINSGNVTSEECPYNTSFASALAGNEIPNANGSTDPNTGLTYAFNLLSASSQLSSSSYGTARRGASKMMILETDGVPNTYRGTTGSAGMVPTKMGYDTYYPTSNWSSGNIGNANSTVEQNAYNVVKQITTQMATTGHAQGSTANSGLSLPNAPALVYPVAFGDLFDSALSPGATTTANQALQFLADVAYYGNTGTSGATSPPSGQVITGDYTTRISLLQTCFQDIFQSGVTVALIE
jgi:hypothetical protein